MKSSACCLDALERVDFVLKSFCALASSQRAEHFAIPNQCDALPCHISGHAQIWADLALRLTMNRGSSCTMHDGTSGGSPHHDWRRGPVLCSGAEPVAVV